eukprot:6965793-Pyramimonas_sp.AAC.1
MRSEAPPRFRAMRGSLGQLCPGPHPRVEHDCNGPAQTSRSLLAANARGVCMFSPRHSITDC